MSTLHSIEIWKPVVGFENYQVSDLGNVRNIGGFRVHAGPIFGTRLVRPHTLKPFANTTTGYMQVILPDRKKHSVHRLVAKAFLGLAPVDFVVNHINGVRSDNRLVNLEWVTQSYNLMHPKLVLGKRNASLGCISSDANKITPIIATNIKTGEEIEFVCAMDAVREYGFSSSSISKCCTGKYSHHKGWKFRFKSGNGFPWSKAS